MQPQLALPTLDATLMFFSALDWDWYNPSRGLLGLGLLGLLLAVLFSLLHIFISNSKWRTISRVVIICSCFAAGKSNVTQMYSTMDFPT